MDFNNIYTSVELSEKLLNAGLPALSADCAYDNEKDEFSLFHIKMDSDIDGIANGTFYPSWSVGRMVEIYQACCKLKNNSFTFPNNTGSPANFMVNKILETIRYNAFNFDKIEQFIIKK